jgi:hypothetical protein
MASANLLHADHASQIDAQHLQRSYFCRPPSPMPALFISSATSPNFGRRSLQVHVGQHARRRARTSAVPPFAMPPRPRPLCPGPPRSASTTSAGAALRRRQSDAGHAGDDGDALGQGLDGVMLIPLLWSMVSAVS